MNIPLLDRLRDADGLPIPIDALGPSPARVHADLDDLEAFGFAIERHPTLGASYRGPADRLCPDQLEWELGTQLVGRRIAVWNRVASTNDLAARAAGSRSNEGLVVLAEEQTAGRGRRGRTWSSPPRSAILMSVLLFPPPPLDRPAWLTALGAVAVAEVVEDWGGRPARIKWPNDVRVAGRKVAGLLVERGHGSVLGVGLNVNAVADDFPAALRDEATSIRILTGEPADRSEVARALIRGLDATYAQGLASGGAPLIAAWRSRLEPMGRLVRVQTRAGAVAGRLVDADPERGLTLADDAGRLDLIPAPEVLALACDDEAATPN